MNTRTLLIGTVAAIALTGAANASASNGWYVGLEAGANWIQDADVVLDGSGPREFSFDTGWAAFGTVGFAWNNFRLELELGYRDNELDQSVGGEGGPVPLDGKFDEFSQMLNVVYDLNAMGPWGVFVGAGAGGDFISYEQNTTHGINLHDDDWVFAWQALAGVNYRLRPNTDLFVGYRYFNAHEPEFSVPGHSDAYDTVHKHTATIGIRYAFGAAPAPEAYVAPPPPPSEPVAVAPVEFIVFFGHNKSTLVPEAMRVIVEAAAAAKQNGSANIRVVGHADRSGSDAYNNALSQRRGSVVKDALTAQGIPAGAISVSARGESEPLVPTADGVREPQNRRVNINL